MNKDEFDQITALKNDALEQAIEILKECFDTVQIVCDDELPPSMEGQAPRTLEYRRGHGNHHARIYLCEQFVQRARDEKMADTLFTAFHRKEEKARKDKRDY